MAMFTDAMKVWPGFAAMQAARPAPPPSSDPASPPPAADPLAEMRRQMDEMRAQIDRLSKP